MSPNALMGELDFGKGSIEGIAVPVLGMDDLTASLIERRHDILAASARIGIAEAMRLPSLSLGAMLGSVTRSESDLFSSGAGTSVSLLWSVLDFGWSRARIGIAKAQREQAKLYWQASVQVAFNEVRSARITFDVATIVRTEALAEHRYQEGLIGLIELLDTRREQLTATTTTTLFKVQGGGCSREP